MVKVTHRKREIMELRDILQLIKKRWLLLFLFTITSLAAAAAVSIYYLQNVYESTTVMIIGMPGSKTGQNPLTLSDYNLNLQLVSSYRVLCKTDRILNQVLSETGSTLTTKELSKKIKVTAQNDTEIISIAVQDGDPDVAAKLANAVATVFEKEIPQIMQMDNVQIIDKAVVSSIPVGPGRTMIIAISGLLGFLLGFGIIFLGEYFDVSIKTTEQLSEILGVPVLGSVPRL